MKAEGSGIGVIGCGTWGMNHLRIWRDLRCLRAVCDIDPTQLEAVRSCFPEVETSLNAQAMLDRPDVEAVVIATPASTHVPLALRALHAGKDVLVEKPMALTTAEGEQLVNTARRLGRVLVDWHHDRSPVTYQAASRLARMRSSVPEQL